MPYSSYCAVFHFVNVPPPPPHTHFFSRRSLFFENDVYNTTFRKCRFDSNSVVNNGGAVYFENATFSVKFRDCQISSNEAKNFGGGFYL